MIHISFKANCAEGRIAVNGIDLPNYQGGKIIITETEFIFNPHIFNFCDKNPRHYNIEV